jgi:hypothetical protein
MCSDNIFSVQFRSRLAQCQAGAKPSSLPTNARRAIDYHGGEEEVHMVARIPGVVAPAALFVAVPIVAFAQGYPSRPLHIVMSFPPAAATDIIGRYVAYELGETPGRQAKWAQATKVSGAGVH